MEVHDQRVPDETYARFLELMPQVCVELVLEYDEGLLLTKRTQEPAKGEWFWPGNRLYKGERLEEAANRLGREELGIEVVLEQQLGVYEHFWDESAAEGRPSRHTVNVVFLAQASDDEKPSLDHQHSEYRFIDTVEPDLHEYVRQYITENNIL